MFLRYFALGIALLCGAEFRAADGDEIILPMAVEDPIEPFNRGVWQFNRGLVMGVVKPTGKVYRAIIREPIRIGARNIQRNLGYPRRVINNALQGKWVGTRDETYRFLANTTMGVGGFFDVASNKFNIPEWEADFGATFGTWGWDPNLYLMLPVYGPSNDRDALGLVLDSLCNPLSYFQPYSYANQGLTYNSLAMDVETYSRQMKSEYDAYYLLRNFYTFDRTPRELDWTVAGEPDESAADTLGAAFFGLKDKDFTARAHHREVQVPTLGKDLPVTYWLQKTNAPIVYLAPGLGAHRWSGGTVGLAELLFNQGFSVATISSAYNYEFIQNALSAPLPGHTPSDVRDYHVALTAVDKYLRRKYPKRIGKSALMGYSMGGFFTLHLAVTNEPGMVSFDRYVALCTPVRLLHGVERLDSFYEAALDWPAAERTAEIENTLRKVVQLTKQAAQLDPTRPLPFSAQEARFLVGMVFKLTLRDMIFNSQRREDLGILQEPLNQHRREEVYREILQYSFEDYLKKFVAAHYKFESPEEFAKTAALRAHESALKEAGKVRIIENANDILIDEGDVEWLRATFGERLQLFPRGGHCGNFGHPAVQTAIVQTVADLR